MEPEPELEPAGPAHDAQLPVWPPHFNLAACGCVGCHVADAAAPWIVGSCAPCGDAPVQGVSLAKGEDVLALTGGGDMQLSRVDQGGGGRTSGGRTGSGVDLELEPRSGTLAVANRRAKEPMVVYLTAVLPTALADPAPAAAAAAAPPAELIAVRKTPFGGGCHFVLKPINLPRQARDKRRRNSKKRCFSQAVGAFKLAHPDMGVKKLTAEFKKAHPEMAAGVGAKEIR